MTDAQLLANPPCSRGNNDDRGGRADGLEDLDQRLLLFRISHKFSPNAHYLYRLSYGEHILFTNLGLNTVFTES